MEGVVDDSRESVGRFRRRRAAVPGTVPLLRRELSEWAAAVGVGPEYLQAVKLAVSEALTNAVVHAFVGASEPGSIELTAATDVDALEIRVTDDGNGMGPRPDSPGLGMGVPMMGKLCTTVDLADGPGGKGTEVRMLFAIPGLVAPSGSRAEDLDEILDALAELGADEGFGGSDIGGLAQVLVPRLADLCSVALIDGNGRGRRVGAHVVHPDGTANPEGAQWVMDFPLTAAAPSLQAAVDGRVAVFDVDEAFAARVSPDARRASELMALGLAWWVAVPLRSGGRAVGSVAIAGRTGDPERAVATLERVASQAGALVATARLVDDLRRTQGRLSQILAALTDAVTVADRHGRFVYANRAAARLLGVDDPQVILDSRPGELAQRFTMADEDGRPIDFEDLPHRRLLRGGEAGSVLTRTVERATGRTRWLRATSTPLDGGRLAVSVVQDLTVEKQGEVRQRLLAEAGVNLTASLDIAQTFLRVARLAVPAIADGCLLEEVGEDGRLQLRVVHHVDHAKSAAVRELRLSHPPGLGDVDGAARALRSGSVELVTEVTDVLLIAGAEDDRHLTALRGLGLRSIASVPLLVRGQPLGVLTLLDDVSSRVFSDSDVELAQELARRAAAAVEAAWTHAERARTTHELEASLRRMQLLAEAGFGGLVRGVEDRMIEANDTFLRMLGYDRVEDLPPWPQMTPPEWAPVDARAIAQMRERGSSDLFEKEYIRRDGTRVRVMIGATVANSKTFEWISVVVDLSARRDGNAVHEAGLDRLGEALPAGVGPGGEVAAVVGALAAAVLIQRPQEGIVYANQAAAEALGMSSPHEVVAASPEQLVAGWDTFAEDGAPLAPARYPNRQLMAGARSAEPLTLRSVNRRTGQEFWRIVRAWPVFDPDGSLAMVVVMTEDITSMRRAQLTQRVFAEAGEILSSSTDYRGTLQGLADVLVPELADWCSIAMPDPYGVIRSVAVAHTDPAKVRFAADYDNRYAVRVQDEGGSAAVLRDGTPVLTPDVPDEMLRQNITDPEQLTLLRSVGMRSVIQVALAPTGGAPIGVLSLINAESGRVFTDVDLAIAVELGRRAGTAVQNARLHGERAHIAATLQASLLPDELPDIPGFSLAAMYRPAGAENWVGGDFYDAFAVPGGWMIIVGDVAGHGAEAAALTAQARHTLRAIGEAFGDPVRAMEHLNRLLVARSETALCAVCAVLLREDDAGMARATISCAGHPQPYLVRHAAAVPVGEYGPLLGAWDSAFTAHDVVLHDGDLLVVYTDGVLDARAGRERFGETRLKEALTSASPDPDALGVVASVRSALDAFQTGEQADDTAIVAIHRDSSPQG